MTCVNDNSTEKLKKNDRIWKVLPNGLYISTEVLLFAIRYHNFLQKLMAQYEERIVRRTDPESVTTEVAPDPAWHAGRIVYYILDVIELVLVFRFALKLLGANAANGFVSFLYAISEPLIAPFRNIFPLLRDASVGTIGTFEPATLIAMVVYAVLAWIIVRLIFTVRV